MGRLNGVRAVTPDTGASLARSPFDDTPQRYGAGTGQRGNRGRIAAHPRRARSPGAATTRWVGGGLRGPRVAGPHQPGPATTVRPPAASPLRADRGDAAVLLAAA